MPMKCVNAHDRCYETSYHGCPYCESITQPRNEKGQFIKKPESEKRFNNYEEKQRRYDHG